MFMQAFMIHKHLSAGTHADGREPGGCTVRAFASSHGKSDASAKEKLFQTSAKMAEGGCSQDLGSGAQEGETGFGAGPQSTAQAVDTNSAQAGRSAESNERGAGLFSGSADSTSAGISNQQHVSSGQRVEETARDDPAKLTEGLGTTMFKCLLLELSSRIKVLSQNKDAQNEAIKVGILNQEGHFVYKRWDPQQSKQVLDESRNPLPSTSLCQTLEVINNRVGQGRGLTRFQATKPIKEDTVDDTVPFFLETSIRDDDFH